MDPRDPFTPTSTPGPSLSLSFHVLISDYSLFGQMARGRTFTLHSHLQGLSSGGSILLPPWTVLPSLQAPTFTEMTIDPATGLRTVRNSFVNMAIVPDFFMSNDAVRRILDLSP